MHKKHKFVVIFGPKTGHKRKTKRANSGFFIHGYEIQILDSYGLEGYNNECGAFYKYKAPSVNKCAPPLQWQTYDVEYRAARFDATGEVVDWPRFTVWHNGQLIHDRLEMTQVSYNREAEMTKPARDGYPLASAKSQKAG